MTWRTQLHFVGSGCCSEPGGCLHADPHADVHLRYAQAFDDRCHCSSRQAVMLCVGGEAWLTFMGNEFGHPEWIDFPREGNDWSHKHCRRQWSLADTGMLQLQVPQLRQNEFLNE